MSTREPWFTELVSRRAHAVDEDKRFERDLSFAGHDKKALLRAHASNAKRMTTISAKQDAYYTSVGHKVPVTLPALPWKGQDLKR